MKKIIALILIFIFTAYAQREADMSDIEVNYPNSLDDSLSLGRFKAGDVLTESKLNKQKAAIIQMQKKMGVLGSDSLLSSNDFTNWGVGYATAYGATANDNTEDGTSINTAINAVPYVIIGKSRADTFIIDKPINPIDNTTLEINGVLKMANTTIDTLTASATAGESSFTVSDASNFEVGDWIGIWDPDDANDETDAGMDREIGESLRITNISSNTITVHVTLDSSYAIGDSIGTINSVILGESVSNVTIKGNGIIDGNYRVEGDGNSSSTRTYIEPVFTGTGEDTRTNSGISFHGSNGNECLNITLKDITVKNTMLHGINFYQVDSSYVTHVTVDSVHDKSFLLRYANWGTIENSTFKNAEFEDGIMFYTTCSGYNVTNNKLYNNGRYGLCYNTSAITNMKSSNNLAKDCGVGLRVGTESFSSINDQVIGGGKYRHTATTRYIVQIINAESCDFFGLKSENSTTGAGAMSIIGSSKYINFYGGYAKDMKSSSGFGYGVLLGLSGGNYPDSVVFNNFTFKNNKVGFVGNSGCYGIKILESRFLDNTSDYSNAARANVYFRNTDGITDITSGVAQVDTGQTYVSIVHGITQYPPDSTKFVITPTNNLGAATNYWTWQGTSNTDFRIYVNTDPDTTTAGDSLSAKFIWRYEE